jgi:molybdenum cofactor cytidylyltransferase
MNVEKNRIKIAAVILAAGASKRFGSNKLLQRIDGISILERTMDSVRANNFWNIAVVTPPGRDLDPILHKGTLKIVNKEWARGIGTSIALATRQFEGDVDGILFLLADQPLIKPSDISRLVLEFLVSPRRIIACSVDGQVRNPILFPSSVFGELKQLKEDKGARSIAESHVENLIKVEVDAPSLTDIDIVDDLQKIESRKKYEEKK